MYGDRHRTDPPNHPARATGLPTALVALRREIQPAGSVREQGW